MQIPLEKLPPRLAKILKLFANSERMNASQVAKIQGLDRARASGYLNNLAQLGYLKRYRDGRDVMFFPTMKMSTKMFERVTRGEILPETIIARFDDARYWLQSIQNIDGGWGQYPEDISYITNTAESILALLHMREPPESSVIQNGTRYVREKLKNTSSEELAARDYAFVGLGLLKVYGIEATNELEETKTVLASLEHNQDHGGSWDRRSVYSTAIVIRFLSNFRREPYSSMVDNAIDWLLSAFNGEGWGRKPNAETDLAVTAQVLFALNEVGRKDFRMELGRVLLLKKVENWSLASEDFLTRGTRKSLWRHFPLACILCALILFEDKEISENVIDGLRELLDLQHESGGWCVARGELPKTWATLNAVMALDLYAQRASRASARD